MKVIKQVPLYNSNQFLLPPQGRWSEVATRCQTQSLDASPLELKTFHIMALMKLKVYQEASLQLQAISEDPTHWPWALRWLQAELPAAMDHPMESTIAMYRLLEACKEEETASRRSGDAFLAQMWGRRRRSCVFALVARHAASQQHKAALLLLDELLKADESDVRAWSQVARVQFLLGDLPAAQRSIERGRAAVVTGKQESAHAAEELAQDAAYLALASGDCEGAAGLYRDCAVVGDVGSVMAEGNAAVSTAAGGNIGSARDALEAEFWRRPGIMLREPMVANLASIYEVVPPQAAACDGSRAKRFLGAWVAGAAPDDFDLSCCKAGAVRSG